jgi:ABC-type uncharacterized transport system substrate-binding protein
MSIRMTILLGLALFAYTTAQAAALPRCLYVSSYHAGYEWNDGIERGMDAVLQGKCEVKKFYMDGKRHLDEAFAKAKALEARELIDTWKPDVVIAADDSASKYLIMPYFKNAAVPVVFCGLNWTAEPYGYPYRNATGMIEVGPIEPLSAEVRAAVKNARRGVFLSASDLTQHKEFDEIRKMYKNIGIDMTFTVARTMAEWEAGFTAAQNQSDFLLIGNNAGITGWDNERARRYVHEHGRRFIVTYHEWMAPYAMLTMAKIPAEQGEWSGKVALLILGGTPPSRIPIVANRRWNMFVNLPLLEKAGFKLSPEILRRAVKVE